MHKSKQLREDYHVVTNKDKTPVDHKRVRCEVTGCVQLGATTDKGEHKVCDAHLKDFMQFCVGRNLGGKNDAVSKFKVRALYTKWLAATFVPEVFDK